MTYQKRLARRRRKKPTLYFHSMKTQMSHWCESNLELDHLLRLEFDPTVIDFLSQPGSAVYYKKGKRKYRYTPDVWVRYADSIEYQEVKPRVFAGQKFQKRISFLNLLFRKKYACDLHTVLDDDIHVDETIPNLWRLYPYLKVDLKKPGISEFIQELPPESTFGSIRDTARKFDVSPTIPFALIANRFYSFDITRPLDDRTRLGVIQ